MGAIALLRALLGRRAGDVQPDRTTSMDDDEFRAIIQQAMATEESQRLLKRWDRMWCERSRFRLKARPGRRRLAIRQDVSPAGRARGRAGLKRARVGSFCARDDQAGATLRVHISMRFCACPRLATHLGYVRRAARRARPVRVRAARLARARRCAMTHAQAPHHCGASSTSPAQ